MQTPSVNSCLDTLAVLINTTTRAFSAPPSIMKPPQKSGGAGLGGEKKRGATIEAKPQIKNVMGDVTRFHAHRAQSQTCTERR